MSSSTINDRYINGELIYTAGAEGTPDFDYKTGLEKLIANKDPQFLYFAGVSWPEFDYDRGLDGLGEIDETGEWIYLAGKDRGWEGFDYNRGLNWLEVKDKTGELIYLAGKNWQQFNYSKGLDILIKKDKDGKWIYLSGKDWLEFDYRKGLNALIERKSVKAILLAGRDWKQFDYPKALNAIKKEFKNEALWKKFVSKEWPQKALRIARRQNEVELQLKKNRLP